MPAKGGKTEKLPGTGMLNCLQKALLKVRGEREAPKFKVRWSICAGNRERTLVRSAWAIQSLILLTHDGALQREREKEPWGEGGGGG